MNRFYTTLFVLALSISQAWAQIPNAGFENWNGTDPASWSTLNPITSLAGFYTANQGSPAPQGSFYLELTSTFSPLFGDVLPGYAVSSNYDFSSGTGDFGGFAYTNRPLYLNGAFKYATAGVDQGLAVVLFTKWNTTTNSRDTIGGGEMLFDNTSSWTNFSAPIFYNLPDNPDTCLVFLTSSIDVAVDGSVLSIDNLDLANAPTTVSESNAVAAFNVFPNPAVDRLNLELSSFAAGTPIQIQVMDIVGNVVTVETAYTNSRYTMNVANLAKGAYVIRVSQNGNVHTQKFIKK